MELLSLINLTWYITCLAWKASPSTDFKSPFVGDATCFATAWCYKPSKWPTSVPGISNVTRLTRQGIKDVDVRSSGMNMCSFGTPSYFMVFWCISHSFEAPQPFPRYLRLDNVQNSDKCLAVSCNVKSRMPQGKKDLFVLIIIGIDGIHPRSLTVRPSKMVVGGRSFPIGKVDTPAVCRSLAALPGTRLETWKSGWLVCHHLDTCWDGDHHRGHMKSWKLKHLCIAWSFFA